MADKKVKKENKAEIADRAGEKSERKEYPANVFAKKIRLAIVEKDKTQAFLADQLNTAHSNINTRITRNNFTEDDMRRFADALGFDVEITLKDRETGKTF